MFKKPRAAWMSFSILLLPLAVVFYIYTSPNKLVQKHRGVSWVAGPKQVSPQDFQPLVKNHVNWIIQTPFGWQTDYNSPNVRLITDGGVFWGETDVGLKVTTQHAKRFGIRTLLKPHIWLRNSSNGKWRGEIEMNSEQDWQSWFASYRTFIFHYARFAERNDIEALAVGTELRTTAVKREQDWRDIIEEIRKVYSGKLTYSANWYGEFEEIPFWDALDYIGIQGYFPLTDKEHPTVDELKAGWQPHLQTIEGISRRHNKPVIFTEIGYRSAADAAIRPWEWPRRRREQATEADLQTQANCYEAFFQTFWQKDWCMGAFFWKWFPKLRSDSDYRGKGFTPQNKPAEQVMANWFKRSLN